MFMHEYSESVTTPLVIYIFYIWLQLLAHLRLHRVLPATESEETRDEVCISGLMWHKLYVTLIKDRKFSTEKRSLWGRNVVLFVRASEDDDDDDEELVGFKAVCLAEHVQV